MPSSIETLSMAENKLKELSDALSACQGLKMLNASKNSLASIEKIQKNEKIEALLLGFNMIRSIKCLFKVKSLRGLAVQKNLVSDSPKVILEWIKSSVGLVVVDFSENPNSYSKYISLFSFQKPKMTRFFVFMVSLTN